MLVGVDRRKIESLDDCQLIDIAAGTPVSPQLVELYCRIGQVISRMCLKLPRFVQPAFCL